MPRNLANALAMWSPTVAVSFEFRRLPPPVIIVGMHRSGTSMVAGMLHYLGVHVDPQLSDLQTLSHLFTTTEQIRQAGYGEAVCFRLLNERLLERAGASWHHPAPFLEIRENPGFRRRCLKEMCRATANVLSREFLAPLPTSFQGAWGWKDPRNSLTLPYWLDLFPEARILHVRRSAEDIASSLIRRAKRALKQEVLCPPSRAERIRQSVLHPHRTARSLGQRLKILPPPSSLPYSVLHREDCLALTSEYVRECVAFESLQDRYMEVHYEDIVEEPERYVQRFADYLQLHLTRSQFESACQFVEPRTERKREDASVCA